MKIRRINTLFFLFIVCVIMSCSFNVKGVSEKEKHSFALSPTHTLTQTQLEDACKIIKSRMTVLGVEGEVVTKDNNVLVRVKQNEQMDMEMLCKTCNVQFLDQDANILFDNSIENFIQSSELKVTDLNEKHHYIADVTISSSYLDDFSQITLQNVGKRLYIVIDGKLYADPVIENEITNGCFRFMLGDKEDSAQHLSYLLAFECLPCEFEVIAEY